MPLSGRVEPTSSEDYDIVFRCDLVHFQLVEMASPERGYNQNREKSWNASEHLPAYFLAFENEIPQQLLLPKAT